MKYTSIIIFFFFTFISTQILAQNTINSSITDNTFEYQGELYQFGDMSEIFSQDILAHKQYVSAINARDNARLLGYVTVGAMGTGIFALTLGSAENCEFLCISSSDAYGLVALLIVTPVVRTAAIISNTKYHKKKHKAISQFNNSIGIGGVENPKLWDLKIGSGQYGYGLVLNF